MARLCPICGALFDQVTQCLEDGSPLLLDRRGWLVGRARLERPLWITGAQERWWGSLAGQPVEVALAPVQHPEAKPFVEAIRRGVDCAHPELLLPLEVGYVQELVYALYPAPLGERLSKLLGAPWPRGQALAIGRAVAAALSVAHDRGLDHLGLSPERVVLGPAGARTEGLKLLDLYLSKLDDTPGVWSAPELAAGGAPTSRADVYSVAAMLFHVLTGFAPATGLRGREGVAPISGKLGQVIERGLDPRPSRRYADATELSAALAVVAAEEAAAQTPDEPPTRALMRPERPRRRLLGWGVGIAGFGVLAAGVVMWLDSPTQAPGEPSAEAPAPAAVVAPPPPTRTEPTTPTLEVPPPTEVEVRLTSEPSGAQVALGDQVLGTTPWRGQLPPGTHRLLLTLEGHQSEAIEVALKAGEPHAEHWSLAPLARPTSRRAKVRRALGKSAPAVVKPAPIAAKPAPVAAKPAPLGKVQLLQEGAAPRESAPSQKVKLLE